jgi:hypothetical protein
VRKLDDVADASFVVQFSCVVRKRRVLTIQKSLVRSKTKYCVTELLLLHFLNVCYVLFTGETRIVR